MSGDLGNSMDLPLEPTTGELHIGDAIISGGVVVMASVVHVPMIGPKPAIVFRFALPDGTFHQPILLVADDDQMAKLRPLVVESIAMARRAASQAGGPR